MSRSWWVNNIGTAATATTPSGGVPQYGLAYQLGTADGWNADTFQTFVEDQTLRANSDQIKALELQQQREALIAKYSTAPSSDNEGIKGVVEGAVHGLARFGRWATEQVSDLAGGDTSTDSLWENNQELLLATGIDREMWDKFSSDGRSRAVIDAKNGQALSLPGIKQTLAATNFAWEKTSNTLETGWILQRNTLRGEKMFWQSGAIGQAWRAAEDRTIGEAVLDGTFYLHKSDADLDRMRRTNSLYQVMAFGGDLAVAFIADPGVLAAKGAGTLRSIKANELPRVGSKGATSALEVLRADDPASVQAHGGIGSRVGYWRGQRMVRTLPELRQAAQEMDLLDFQNLPIFRRKAISGGDLAYAFKYAAGDDRLWDLTRRAAFGDVDAWREIRAMKDGNQEILGKYQGSNPQNYLDALDVAKTNEKKLQTEIEDLQKTRDEAARLQGVDQNTDMFRIYSYELDRSLADKTADLEDLTGRLARYEDYQTWLETQKQFSFVDETGNIDEALYYGGSLTSTSVKPERLNFLSRRTYKSGPYGAVHTAHGITKAGWVREANTIDLHRVSSGTESLMRQFEQLNVQLNYVNRDGVNDALERFGKARDEFERFQVAREIEDEHLPRALAEYFGLEDETVRMFMDTLRERKDRMVNALLSGEGSIYSTAGDISKASNVKVLSRKDGYVRLQFAEGNKLTEMTVPESALEVQSMPVDPTQTPNYYQPLNARDIKLAIRRDADLFRELETARKNRGRQAVALMMNSIDEFGGRWNRFWKPLQLFRLGWPQRVLMDEMLRGTVMLGAHEAFKKYGTAFTLGSINAVTQHVVPAVLRTEKRAFMKAGPGPVTDELSGRSYDVADLDEALDEAPVIPARFEPTINKTRAAQLDQLNKDAEELDQYLRDREMARQEHVANAPRSSMFDTYAEYEEALDAHMARGEDLDEMLPELDHDGPWVAPLEPLLNTTDMNFIRANPVRSVTFDPLTGRKQQNGWAIPVAFHLETELKRAKKTFASFLRLHRDLLASGGYRVMAERRPSGITYRVVRVFNSTESQTAADFLQHVDANVMYNLSKGGQTEYVRQWDDVDPVTEYVHRPTFVNKAEKELVPGESPAEGVGPVFHGSQDGLPEDLLPREQVPAALGNMVGQGFYTSVDSDFILHSNYAQGDPSRFYTIKGSKSGRQYEVFDVDQPMLPADKDEFIDFATEYYRQELNDPDYVRENLTDIDSENYSYWLADTLQSSTWLDLFKALEHVPRPGGLLYNRSGILKPQQLLTNFLESRRGAGALTHVGGGGTHQVYVWLRPEDLLVRPAYQPTGKFHTLESWLLRTDAQERIVDESRIHRVGPKPREIARRDFAAGTQQSGRLGDIETRELDPELDFSSWDSPHDSFLRNLMRKREFGKGTISMKAGTGEKVVYNKAFEGPGETYLTHISGAPAYARLTDRYKRTLSQYRQRAVGYKRLQPPKVDEATLRTRGGWQAAREYYTYWADMLNHQIRNSPIWYKMLEGRSNDEIVDWLMNTAEGAKIRASLPHKGQHPEYWVEEHRFQLDTYLPNKAMQRQLAAERVKPTDLRRIPDADRPDVAAEDLELINGTGIGAIFGRTVEKVYHALGTVPTDVLNRQPFFAGMYDLKMKNLIGSHTTGPLDNAALRGYEKQAREFALAQVRRTMFDLADDTNMSAALRFVAPFWGAQSEALEKWFRMFVQKPETVARFYAGSNVAYDRLMIINEDGEQISEPDSKLGYNPNDRIVLQIPENFKKIPPFDKMLEQFGSVDFSIGSLNASIQGENPLLPSLGPLVVVPANTAVNAMWDTHATEFDENFFYRWLFPVGRASGNPVDQMLDQTAPGWLKRAYAQLTGTESRMYNSVYWSVYREMDLANKAKGLPAPTPDEVAKAVQWHMGLRVVGSFGLPVQLNFRPKHQFFLDEYHRMIREVGPGPAFEEFVKKYGVDAAYFAASSSSSVGVPSTSEGMAEWSKSKKMIQQFPEWADAIISPDAWADDFSSDAYDQQFDISLGPGSTKNLREITDPLERQRLTDVRTGWLQFRQFSAAIDAELFNRGLTSLQQSAAADLAAIKRDFVVDLMSRNKAWSEDYDTLSNTINQRIGELQQIAGNRVFDNRPEWQGVRQYLVIRSQAVGYLESLAARGGSRNLQAEDNAPVRNWFYTQVGQLVQANPAFGEFYSRWLSTDRLEGRASQQ